MKLRFLIFYILVFSASKNSNCQINVSNYDINKKYSDKELLFDVQILKEALEKTHPGLFWYISQEKFNTLIETLKDSIKAPKSEIQFYNLLNPLINNIKCGHTSVRLSDHANDYINNNLLVLPFNFDIINSKIYIGKNWLNNPVINQGDEIISIKNKTAESILQSFDFICSGDGYNKSLHRLERFFNLNFCLINGSFDKYSVSLKTSAGEIKNVVVDGIFLGKLKEFRMKNFERSNHVDSLYQLTLIDSMKTGIMKIVSFGEDKFQNFLKKSFLALKKGNIRNLIIDLRNNGGGYDENGLLLYSYLALAPFKFYNHIEITVDNPNDSIFKYIEKPFRFDKEFKHNLYQNMGNGTRYLKNSLHPNLKKTPFKPQKMSFNGNVYVLINNKSFSTTVDFCSVASSNKRIKLIGQETCGGACGNSSGNSFLLRLPHTNIIVDIPTFKYINAANCIHGRGVIPDYETFPNFFDYINHIDQEMNFAFKLINNQN